VKEITEVKRPIAPRPKMAVKTEEEKAEDLLFTGAVIKGKHSINFAEKWFG
jgi:hypothetical protein